MLKSNYIIWSCLLITTLVFFNCSWDLFNSLYNTPTKDKMEGVWVLTEAYDENDSNITKDLNFPVTAFYLGSGNQVSSTGGPMFLHIVYGNNNYTKVMSKIDQVMNYASLSLTAGEWFIDDGNVDRFTIEMKLEGLPGQKTIVELLKLIGIGSSDLDVTIYHKFMDVQVTFGESDTVMTWVFDDQTTAVYNTKDKYGNSVSWRGLDISKYGFEHGTYIFHKRSKDIEEIIQDAVNNRN